MHTTYNAKWILGSVLVASIGLAFSSGAFAAGKHSGGHGHGTGAAGHGHGGGSDIGKSGKASEVTRTVTVTMTDNRYAPKRIEVKKGETIRFIVNNKGEFVHEFNIGTAKMHKAHRKEMMKMMERGVLEADKINHAKMKMDKSMAHNDPNSTLLEPSKSGEIIWQFGESGTLEFACNIPGHYESGMVGKISIH